MKLISLHSFNFCLQLCVLDVGMGCEHATVHMGRLENNFMKSVFGFHLYVLNIKLRFMGLHLFLFTIPKAFITN